MKIYKIQNTPIKLQKLERSNKSKRRSILVAGLKRVTVDLQQAIKTSSTATVSTIIISRKTRSSSNQSRGSTGTCDDYFVNHAANTLFEQCLKDYPLTREGLYPLTKKVCEKFVWYDPFQITGFDSKP